MPSSLIVAAPNPDPERLWPSAIFAIRDYALLLLDPLGHIVSWNKGAELLQGYQGSEIIGQHFSCLYPPEDIAAGRPEHDLTTAAMVGRREAVADRVRKDGSRFLAD